MKIQTIPPRKRTNKVHGPIMGTNNQNSGKTDKLLSILGQLAFFKEMTSEEKKVILSKKTSVQRCKEGASIIRENNQDKCIYIILKGSVSVVQEQGEKPLAKLNTGNIFGEVSFLTSNKRTTNIVANEYCILLRLDKSIMAEFGANIREKIKDQIILQLIDRTQKMNKKVRNLTKISALLLVDQSDRG